MKKVLAFVVMAACLLAACGTQPGGGADGSQPAAGSDATAAAPKGGPLVHSGEYSYLGTGTDAGFYFLKSAWNTGELNITYIDYATQKHVYLCSNLSCAHNDDSCTSYVEHEAGAVNILTAGDKLLLFIDGMMSYDGRAAILPRVEVMDLNGANRKTLVQLSETQSLDGYNAIHDGVHVYFVCNTIISETAEAVEQKRELVRISLAGGALESICELEGWSNFTGAQGRDIYLQRYEESRETPDQEKLRELDERMEAMYADPEAYTDEDFAAIEHEYSAIYEKARAEELIIMQLLNVDSGEIQTLNQWKRGEMEDSWYLTSDGIYFIETEQGVLKKQDLATGDTAVVTDQLPKRPTSDESFNSYYINSIYTNWMFLDYSQQEGEVYTTARMAVNRQNGEVKDMSLRPDVAYLSGLVAQGGVRPLLDDTTAPPATPRVVLTNGGWGTDPVQIISEVGDKFLVVSGYDIRTEMYDGKVGDLYPIEVETPIYALITQDDYVNSRPNYIDVEFIE